MCLVVYLFCDYTQNKIGQNCVILSYCHSDIVDSLPTNALISNTKIRTLSTGLLEFSPDIFVSSIATMFIQGSVFLYCNITNK